MTPEEDFLKHYFSSGSLESRLRENPSNFECSIIFRSGETKASYWYEQLLIRENIRNPKCANKHYIDPDKNLRAFSTAGKPHSQESKKKMSDAIRGSRLSDETRLKMSIAHKGKPSPTKGTIVSFETKQKISAAKKGKPKEVVICPVCAKAGGSSAMKRWHFNNCKSKI